MCYHVSVEVEMESILDVFPDLVVPEVQLEVQFQKTAYQNGFDHKTGLLMLRSRKTQKRHLAEMMWGFVPDHIKNMEEAERFWNGYRDEKGLWHKGYITLNAVGEELFEKTMYAESALTRRCILFVDSFYEWHHHYPIGKKGKQLKTAIKYPFNIYLKDNPYPFSMIAAIWTPWKHEEVDKETGELQKFVTPTFAIVTAKANALMAKIHNSRERMPTILNKELAEEWISDGLSEKRITEIAAYQYPSEQMDAHPISKDFQESGNPKQKHVHPDFQLEVC